MTSTTVTNIFSTIETKYTCIPIQNILAHMNSISAVTNYCHYRIPSLQITAISCYSLPFWHHYYCPYDSHGISSTVTFFYRGHIHGWCNVKYTDLILVWNYFTPLPDIDSSQFVYQFSILPCPFGFCFCCCFCCRCCLCHSRPIDLYSVVYSCITKLLLSYISPCR